MLSSYLTKSLNHQRLGKVLVPVDENNPLFETDGTKVRLLLLLK